MSLNRVIRGSLWIYVASIASNFLAYVYWLLATRFVPSSTVGDAAAIVGVVAIITSFLSLGISSGATRMFGRAWGHGDLKSLSSYFASSLAAYMAINGIAALLVFLLGSAFGLTNMEVPYVTVLIILSALPPVPTALYNSVLKTSSIALSAVLSSLLRIGVGIALLYLGTGFTGVMIAYILSYIIQDAVLFVMLRGVVSRSPLSLAPVREAIRSGIPSWIPSLVATAGSWLGVLGIYSLTGSAQAGTYYIAFSIAQIVYSVPYALLGLMFPVLSGMEDGRKRATNRSIRLTYVIMAPLAALVIAYPYVPLSMLGSSYLSSSLALQILLIGCFITPIPSGFDSMIYAYGKFRYVTVLGLATNIPRMVLYPFLVALWGDNGAAVSYIAGLFIALVVVFFMARRIGYSVGWGSLLAFCAIPSLVAVLMVFTGLNWVIGTLITLAVSFFAYARLGLVTRSDLVEVFSAFLSQKQLDSIYPYVKYIMRALYGE